ncbi:DUF5719 family protein [Microbacterium album]|uniref:Large extracellular alpha-helical protein n=1 Tax=Microbacterium album TaxID=2053191 RepID=A0A917IEJ6_9MICO|nr:DUF5719 family protein [Microbacterium album]GGH37630.1 hypothetical protein GCM10010921_07670 [Microbacterium album]
MTAPAPRRTPRARLALGAAVAAGAVAASIGAAALPWPEVSAAAPALEVTPLPAETLLACDGPVLALGRAAEEAAGLAVAAPARLTTGNDRGEEPQPDAMGQPRVAGEAIAERFAQLPAGREPVSIAAASSAAPDDPDLAGFTASACRPGLMESWIVGGDTTTGVTGILLLANPGDVNATVRVTAFGVMGAQTPPGADAIPIPARTQVALPLAGLAGGEQRPVLRVTATGAPVRASLQSSLIRTLEPEGVDSQPAVRPASAHVIPGVHVTARAAASDSAVTVVRLLSESDATATITVAGADSQGQARALEPVRLEAGRPLEVEVPGLAEGDHTVVVSADAPLVTAVWQTTGFGPGSDYAWHTPSPTISAPTIVAVPPGEGARLSLANPSDADIVVAVTEDGDARETVVPARGSAIVEVSADRIYTVDPGGADVHAAVGFASGSGLAALPVWPDAARPQPVVVYP